MVDIKKYKKEIKKKILNNDNSLSGCTGYCFIESKKVIKIYNRPYNDLEIEDLSGYSSSRISFPYEYIKKRKFYLGEVLPYFAVGNILDSIQLNCDLDRLIENYKILVDEIIKYHDIVMYDLSYPNILYDENKGFFLIDVTNWKKYSIYDDNIKKINISSLNDSLMYCFYDMLFGNGFDLIIGNRENDLYICNIFGMDFYNLYLQGRNKTYDFLKLLNMYREIMLKKYGIFINNTEDMKKSVKILKKS